jgi:hypothetical protein
MASIGMVNNTITDSSLESTEIGTTTADGKGEGTHKWVYSNLHIWYGDVSGCMFYFGDMFGSVFNTGDMLRSVFVICDVYGLYKNRLLSLKH